MSRITGTGDYNAAYNPELVTQNQRAGKTFEDVVVPILHLVQKTIPPGVTSDAVGFEISYHVRRHDRNHDYEGKEILVVVLDNADAFSFFESPRDSDRQEILNRSEIYVDGKDFGLALGERDPLPIQALARPTAQERAAPAAAASSSATVRLPHTEPGLPPELHPPTVTSARDRLSASGGETPAVPAAAATQADADRLQAKYQPHLDALAKAGRAGLHFVDYAPPSFVIFRNQVALQISLRNTAGFSPSATSIYKRAAQSFNLFLAPELKAIVEKVPDEPEIAGIDLSVLNELAAKPKPSSEAVEYVCPIILLRRFTDADITNQDLINQSAVLVNGVRIVLNLQQVE